MTLHVFHSCLAEHMQRFVDLRQMVGKDYRRQALNLSYFERFLIEQRWNRQWITRQIINSYRLSLTHLSTATQRCRMPVVRQFCIYLSAFEPCCYVPVKGEWVPPACPRRLPFIFTNAQVCRLVEEAGRLSSLPFALRPHVYQTLFGLLYVTGMRISEALSIDVGDVDIQRQRILVRKGKFGKQRWLPLVDSTAARLRRYLQRRLVNRSCTAESPLFISVGGNRLPKRSADYNFQAVVRACGIGQRGRNHPTPHSLRHSFACHCLLKWYRQGVDINARLPVLATYMGHADWRFTYRYLHATPELLDEANRRFLNHYRQITNPEVNHE
jgi:site-specific recombinase XerD